VEELKIGIRSLQLETKRLNDALCRHTRTTRRWMIVVAVVLVAFAATGLLGAWELHRQVESSRRAASDQWKLCPLLELLVPQAGESRPSTSRGAEVARRAGDLYRQIGC
jgi:hypothetical protein